ncbi:GAF and ANTAR domain-containing protein [Microlunatus flavus]|uniref:GAF domain-containing protein n=1 Tax=Microlunatus flavus TaxID=1036181 RepID=A0A1H9IHZ3_9ACTN|nr:GAF and ANTAR domain-containing protein [Microlunatus flavus]SEQ74233.1 GAF domain-containing protein [Microlunatus flavus]
MSDLRTLHEELVAVVLVGRDLDQVLAEIVGVARRGMPGAEAVSITLIRGDEPYTAAHDGQMALDADELQYERGYGPCMDAGRSGQVFLVEDMAAEDRWPDYSRHAAEHGVGSSLSVPLPFQGTRIGGLNTYSSRPHAFGEEDVEVAEEIALWTAYAIGTAAAAAVSVDDAAQMRSAMLHRSVIEQAKGILMERYKITADPAFTLLSRSSQRTGTKLRAVADALVRTGTLPGTEDQPR